MPGSGGNDDNWREETCKFLDAKLKETKSSLKIFHIHSLMNDNKPTWRDVVTLSEKEILKIPNFGKKGLADVKEYLMTKGLHLGMDASALPKQPTLETNEPNCLQGLAPSREWLERWLAGCLKPNIKPDDLELQVNGILIVPGGSLRSAMSEYVRKGGSNIEVYLTAYLELSIGLDDGLLKVKFRVS